MLVLASTETTDGLSGTYEQLFPSAQTRRNKQDRHGHQKENIKVVGSQPVHSNLCSFVLFLLMSSDAKSILGTIYKVSLCTVNLLVE